MVVNRGFLELIGLVKKPERASKKMVAGDEVRKHTQANSRL